MRLLVQLLICCCLIVNYAFGQIVFQENFDTGIPATWTINDGGSSTDTWFGTTGGYTGSNTNYLDGTEFALIDADAAGEYTTVLEQLTTPVFDGTPYSTTGLALNFDQFFRTAYGIEVGIIDVWDGTAWANLDSIKIDDGQWNSPAQKMYDLTPHINAAMQIRFTYDDMLLWGWYWAIDNVLVSSTDIGATSIFATNGRIGTSNALTNAEAIGVEITNFTSVDMANFDVSLFVDGSLVSTETVPGPVVANSSLNFTFTASADLSTLGDHTIEIITGLTGDINPSNDSLTTIVTQLANPVITLPYCEGFEGMDSTTLRNNTVGLPGATTWDFETDMPGIGRLRTEAGAGYANTGTQAITLDQDPSGTFVINYATATLNMSSYNANIGNPILLSFFYMEHGDEVQPNDLVWIRGSETDTWIELLDWNVGTGGSNGVYFSEIDISIGDSLLANGQNFSATTQIRFGQEDNFPSTTITSSDGLSFDDVKVRELLSNDLAVAEIVSNDAFLCGGPNTFVDVYVTNVGTQPQSNIPVSVNLTGATPATLNGTIAGPLNLGDTLFVTIGPFNTSAGGMVTIDATSNLATDQLASNNMGTITLDYTAEVFAMPIATSTCLGSTGYAVSAPNPNGQNSWYDMATGSVLLGTGDSLELGVLMADSTVLLSTQVVINNTVGEPALFGGAQYTFFGDGLIFDVTHPLVLDSVFVYPGGPGDVVVNLRDANNVVVQTTTVTITDTLGDRTTIPIGFSIPSGTGYTLDADGSTVVSMNRENSGAVYPYATADISLTGALNGLAGYYYFFYDWHYTALGCPSDPVAVTVTVTELVSNTVVDNNVSCTGGGDGSATATGTNGTAPYTYAWDNGDNTATTNGLAAGNYTVTISDANGCSTEDMVTITEPTALTSSAGNTTDVSCNGGNDGSASATGSGGTSPYVYAWSNGETSATAIALTAGINLVTITDANGCSTTDMVMIAEPTALTSSAGNTTDVSCNGGNDGSATAIVSGGTSPYVYAWSNGETSATAIALAAGPSLVTVTDANGCSTTDMAMIAEPMAITTSIGNVLDASCNGNSDGVATATASGGTSPYTYSWDNGETTALAVALTAGNHTVTTTDANGCATVAMTSIGEPTTVAVSISTTNVSCNGSNDGSATANGSGGVLPYSYTWSNGADVSTASGLAAGSYSVTIIDVNGCSTMSMTTISEPTSVIGSAVVTDESVDGLDDGAIDLSPSGGTAPYTFDWDNGATTEDLTDLPDDTYCVVITDANTCTSSACYEVMAGVMSSNQSITSLSSFNLYPNPTNALANVEVSFNNQVDLRLELVNVLGQVVYQEIFTKVNSINKTIDLNAYAEGVYFLHLEVGQQRVTKRLLLQK